MEGGRSLEEQIVRMKTREEMRQDIINEMHRLQFERGSLTVEYKARIQAIDNKYAELNHKLMSQNY